MELREVKKQKNLLDDGLHSNSAFDKKNRPAFGKNNSKGKGLTSIKGRVDKHKNRYRITIPPKPDWMNQSDYDKAINNEYRTGDGGDNVHAGANYTHSSGCVVLGFAPNCSSSYQESLEQDLRFKAAIACAMRINPDVKLNTLVSPLPPIKENK